MNNYFNSPEFRALMALQESPLYKAMKALEESPLVKAARELQESPLIRAAREAENSPLRQALKELEISPMLRMANDLHNSGLLQAVRELEDSPMRRAAKALGETDLLRAMREAGESPGAKLLRELESSPTHKLFRALENTPSMTAFLSASEKIARGHGALSFAEAYDLVTKEYENAHEGNAESSFIKVSSSLANRARFAPPGPLSFEFYINLIFALVLFYLSESSSNESEARILDQIAELEDLITTQLRVDEGESGFLFFVVRENINLRSGPGLEREVLVVLPSQLKVIGQETSGDWIRVEYFDYLNNIDRTGWVDSHYLIPVLE